MTDTGLKLNEARVRVLDSGIDDMTKEQKHIFPKPNESTIEIRVTTHRLVLTTEDLLAALKYAGAIPELPGGVVPELTILSDEELGRGPSNQGNVRVTWQTEEDIDY